MEREMEEIVKDLENFMNNSKYLTMYEVQRNIIYYGTRIIPDITRNLIGLSKEEITEKIKENSCTMYGMIRYISSKMRGIGIENTLRNRIEENLEEASKILEMIIR